MQLRCTHRKNNKLRLVFCCRLLYFAVLQDYNEFYDGQVLPTLYSGGNLTVITDNVNGTEQIIIVSPASEAMIITPPIYACNVRSHPQLLPAFFALLSIT